MDLRQSLSMRINEEVTDSQFPRGSRALFAPRWILNTITEESIMQHFLNNSDTGSIPLHVFDKSLVGYILKDVKELFAICVAISMPTIVLMRFLQSLKIARLTDERIPRIGETAMAVFPRLNRSLSWNLIGHRYMFQAPILSQDLRHLRRDLHDHTPLPIDFCDNTPLTGGFGTVYKVRIHRMFLVEPGPMTEVRLSCFS